MSGVAFLAHEPLPSACRIVFIRVRDTPNLNNTNRFFEPVAGAISADLVDLGIDLPEAGRLDAFVRKFVGTTPIQATPQDQTTLASLLDRSQS
jgi:hypothetical protein